MKMNFVSKLVFYITLIVSSVICSGATTHSGSDAKVFRTEQVVLGQTTDIDKKAKPNIPNTTSSSSEWRMSLVDFNRKLHVKEKTLILQQKVFLANAHDLKFIHRPAREPFAHSVS
jgi:hypothetical protein